MDGLRVIKAGKEDFADICKLEKECFATPWPAEVLYEDLHAKPAQYFLLKDGNDAIGYASIWMILDEAHINKICIAQAQRGKGYGKYLLLRALEEVSHRGADSMTLEVRRSNTVAISMYESCGFKIEGVRKRYYEDTGEDALIMWKKEMEQKA